MRTVPIEVYQFDELDIKAKERARDWYRQSGCNDFAYFVIEDAARIAELLGITLEQQHNKTSTKPKIWWSGFSSQGDGASYEGSYGPVEGKALDHVKSYAPEETKLHLIASRLDALQEKFGNRLTAKVSQSGNYYHEYTMRLDCVDEIDSDCGEPVDFSSEDEKELLDALRAFANWIYGQLKKEYNYQNSDEVVDESIRANEYEFDASGRLFRYEGNSFDL